MSVDPELLYTCGDAYNINPVNGIYEPDDYYSNLSKWAKPPKAISAPALPPTEGDGASSTENLDLINACLVGYTDSMIVAAFRGTIPHGKTDSVDDWLEDLFIVPKQVDDLPGEVHSGFYDAVKSIITGVSDELKTLHSQMSLPIFVTGHSKGGAMAALAAYLLKQTDGLPIQQVVTFAAPRCGNTAFQVAYQQLFGDHLRFENYGDIIPLLPATASSIAFLAALAGKYISSDLAKLIRDAESWGYTALGSEVFVESQSEGYKLDPVTDPDFDVGQTVDVAFNLGLKAFERVSPEVTLVNAHTLAYGYGYMSGICPDAPPPPPTAKVAPVL